MEVSIQKGKFNFVARCNEIQIREDIKSIDYYRNEYSDYTEIYSDKPLTKELYSKLLEDFKMNVEKELNEDKLKEMIKKFPKKKNGTFNRRKVQEVVKCNIASFYTSYTNAWEYYSLQYRAISDTELELSIIENTSTY